MHYKNFTNCYHNAIIITITVSTFNNNNRISILNCAYYESKICKYKPEQTLSGMDFSTAITVFSGPLPTILAT